MSDPTAPETVRCVSYGAGVQSTALLVMQARGLIDYPLFIFANTGDDSEHPDSLAYMSDVARPYAKEHGIELVEVRKDGPTLLQEAMGYPPHESKSFPLPFRGDSGPPMSRACTSSWKIAVIQKELRKRGATKKHPAHVALGISTDEIQRAKSPGEIDPRSPSQMRFYPLIDARMNRGDCLALIRDEGLPEPSKSACWFCPWHSRDAWIDLRNRTPHLFEQSVELERRYKERLAVRELRTQWITDHGAKRKATLDEVIDDQQVFDLFGEECEGFCHT
jgi:hypothetical protein